MGPDSNNIYDLLVKLANSLSYEELMFAEIASDLAVQITARRVELGLTQAEFAEKNGETAWENANCDFSLKTLIEIADKLHLPLTVSFKSTKTTA